MAKKKVVNKTEEKNTLLNGLADTILGINQFGSFGTQLSQTDTLQKNIRGNLISNNRNLLSQIYAELGLIQAIVDVPVDDGLRGGIEIKTKQLDEDQIDQLQKEMKKKRDISVVGQALKWNRLFGGAGVMIMTNEKPDVPFMIDSITEQTPVEFKAVDMWELSYGYTDGRPEATVETVSLLNKTYNYYGITVDKSRVLKLVGMNAPSFIRQQLRGWGMSEIEKLVRSVNQYLKGNDVIFEVLDEFKVDVYKIEGLAQAMLSRDGEQVVRRRIALANQQKNFQNAITMDGKDDFQQKELNFTGIAETMSGIRMHVASDMRIPLTKLFGVSASGFNSGEDDIENYNSMVESQVREKAEFHLMQMVEIRCKQMFGFVPDDMAINFKPLRILSSEQEENVKTQKFARVIQALQAGSITELEFRESVNRDNLLPIKLDTTAQALGEVDDMKEDGAEDGDVGSIPKEDRSKLEAKESKQAKNSVAYDVASYQVDGGDLQFDAWRRDQIDRLPQKDLVQKAKDESMKAFGKEKWQFVLWAYRKFGGKL